MIARTEGLPAPDMPMFKRGDLVVGAIKTWISENNLVPGDRLPNEAKLQEVFGVSRGVVREALKALEMQGLVQLITGPKGGAQINKPPFDRTFHFVQNHLFFQDLTVADIYELRLLVEPEIAAGAVPHLTEADFEEMEASIEFCLQPAEPTSEAAKRQRHEELNFHDILARANPNPMLRFTGFMVNESLRVDIEAQWDKQSHLQGDFGKANAASHRRILAAARARDAELILEEARRDTLEVKDFILNRLQARLRKELLDKTGPAAASMRRMGRGRNDG